MEFAPSATAAAVAILMTVQMASRRKMPPTKFWIPVVVVEALVVFALVKALVSCIPAD
jgi:hypothetical protein